jgi:phosphoglycolate phosphatase
MKRLNSNSAIIFDFDGVLADTGHVAIKIIERIANSKNIAVPPEDFIRTHDPKTIMKSLGIKWWQLPYMGYLARKWAIEINPQASLFPWGSSLLNTAHALSNNVWIVSSNSPERIIKTLSMAGISFDKKNIIANVGFLSKSKYLKKIINKQKLDSDYVVYVGDEARDITAAHKAGIRCLSVGWGFQSSEFLSRLNSGMVLEDPELFESTIKAILCSTSQYPQTNLNGDDRER